MLKRNLKNYNYYLCTFCSAMAEPGNVNFWDSCTWYAAVAEPKKKYNNNQKRMEQLWTRSISFNEKEICSSQNLQILLPVRNELKTSLNFMRKNMLAVFHLPDQRNVLQMRDSVIWPVLFELHLGGRSIFRDGCSNHHIEQDHKYPFPALELQFCSIVKSIISLNISCNLSASENAPELSTHSD